MEESILRLAEISESMCETINAIVKNKLDRDIILDEFKQQKQDHYTNLINNSIKELDKINNQIGLKVEEYQNLIRINELVKSLLNIKGKYKQSEMLEVLKELKRAIPKVNNLNVEFELSNIPSEIKSEVLADLREAKKCFDNGSYRSCTILCGRVLEICLHRKYYELTKKDILETSPGLGLGKLIAKLKELNVLFDPGITEQIHLINNIRIDSVHKKQVTFNPSRSQAHAMILYSVDVINKLF